MAKPGLGTKRLCQHCSAKFYDLEKNPIVCPKCGTVFEVLAPTGRGRPDAGRAAPVQDAETPEVQDAEFVSLEEADAEASGGKAGVVDADVDDEDVEIDDDGEDDTFLEEDEDEGDDVSDIIGGDIENEEET